MEGPVSTFRLVLFVFDYFTDDNFLFVQCKKCNAPFLSGIPSSAARPTVPDMFPSKYILLFIFLGYQTGLVDCNELKT